MHATVRITGDSRNSDNDEQEARQPLLCIDPRSAKVAARCDAKALSTGDDAGGCDDGGEKGGERATDRLQESRATAAGLLSPHSAPVGQWRGPIAARAGAAPVCPGAWLSAMSSFNSCGRDGDGDGDTERDTTVVAAAPGVALTPETTAAPRNVAEAVAPTPTPTPTPQRSAPNGASPRITKAAQRHGSERRRADGLPVWERMHRHGAEMQLKLDLRRRRGREEDEKEAAAAVDGGGKRRYSPAINRRVRSPSAASVVTDVGLRLHGDGAARAVRAEMRRTAQVDAERSAAPFSPTITPKARAMKESGSSSAPAAAKKGRLRCVDTLHAWETDRRLRAEAASRRAAAAAEAGCTHRPQIDPLSRAIAAVAPLPTAKLLALQSDDSGDRGASADAAAAENAAGAAALITVADPATPVHERLLLYGQATAAARAAAAAARHTPPRAPSSSNGRGGRGAECDVFERLQREAQERQHDSVLRELASELPPGPCLGVATSSPFRSASARRSPGPASRRRPSSSSPRRTGPRLGDRTRALVGDTLPVHEGAAVHERLLRAAEDQQRRVEERREREAAAAAVARDVGRYLTPTTVLLAAMRTAGRSTSTSQTASRAGRKEEAEVGESGPHTPRVSEMSRVLDAVRLGARYGDAVPDRVSVLHDERRAREAALDRARAEQREREQQQLARELGQQRRFMQQRHAAAAKLRGDGVSGSAAAAAPRAHAPQEGGSARGEHAVPVHDRQMAWRSAKLQQLERKRDELRAAREQAEMAECSFRPSTAAAAAPSPRAAGASSLTDAHRLASPGTRMRKLLAAQARHAQPSAATATAAAAADSATT